MRRLATIALLLAAVTLHAQNATMRFKKLPHQMPPQWFASAEAMAVADTVVKYQFRSGGWAKNMNWNLPATEGNALKARQEVWRQINSESGVGATIDNGATTAEMLLLAKVCDALSDKARKDRATRRRVKTYRDAFVRGLEYLLEAQYDNGGWPQFYPLKPFDKEGHAFYSNHITFNDDAMCNVLRLLRDVYDERAPHYRSLGLSEDMKQRLRASFDKGIECILDCQIMKDGRLTVWCQQHDEHTLEPAPARAYELASFTGSHETADLVKLLMSLPHPTDRVVAAVTAAVAWLEAHAIRDMRLETFTNDEGKRDRRLVHHFGSTVWARFYDLQTEEPFVCDRDGKPQPALEYIGYERRNGYGWYGTTPAEVISAFPEWLKTVRP